VTLYNLWVLKIGEWRVFHKMLPLSTDIAAKKVQSWRMWHRRVHSKQHDLTHQYSSACWHNNEHYSYNRERTVCLNDSVQWPGCRQHMRNRVRLPVEAEGSSCPWCVPTRSDAHSTSSPKDPGCKPAEREGDHFPLMQGRCWKYVELYLHSSAHSHGAVLSKTQLYLTCPKHQTSVI